MTKSKIKGGKSSKTKEEGFQSIMDMFKKLERKKESDKVVRPEEEKGKVDTLVETFEGAVNKGGGGLKTLKVNPEVLEVRKEVGRLEEKVKDEKETIRQQESPKIKNFGKFREGGKS